jgi:hypothetical protein
MMAAMSFILIKTGHLRACLFVFFVQLGTVVYGIINHIAVEEEQ